MTILHLISSAGYYGAESMLVTLAEAQVRFGHTVVVAAFQNVRNPHTEVIRVAKQNGLAVATVSCAGRWDPDVPRHIGLLCDRYAAHILHTHGYKADIYAVSAAARADIPLLATCHGWPDPTSLMQAYAILDRRRLRRFDRVVAVADPIAEVLRRSGIPPHRLTVIWNGVDVNRFAAAGPSMRTKRGWGARPVVGFAGRLVEGKGGRVLLQAARLVTESLPEALFVLAGEGPSRYEWEILARELRIEANVEFLGEVGTMPEFYASLDVFTLPSYAEAMPMSVLEAAAAGKPVVATNVGGIPSAVKQGITGHLVDVEDSAALATAIKELLARPDKARLLGAAGRDHISAAFSSDQTALRYCAMYRELLAQRNGRSRDQRAS